MRTELGEHVVFKKLLSMATALVLLLSFTAAPVFAADTSSLAGKPINGDGFGTGSTCHGTIYGRWNGTMVLFIPYHCSGGTGLAKVWYGPSGQRIGITGPTVSGVTGSTTDMAWIVLDAGDYPTSLRNRIFVGSSSFYNTQAVPGAAESCANINYYDTYKVGYWPTSTTSQGPWNGTIAGVSNNSTGCDITTTHDNNLGTNNIPSGAPLWNYTDSAFIGDAKSRDGNNRTVFASWRQAMINLRAIYGTDTYFCADSDC
jgi:hypothetical protein